MSLPSEDKDKLSGRLDQLERAVVLLAQKFQEIAGLMHQAEEKYSGPLLSAVEMIRNVDQKTLALHSAALLTDMARAHPKKDIVLFKGRGYFGDNIKYAFLAFTERAAEHGVEHYFVPGGVDQEKMLRQAGLPCLPATFEDYRQEELAILLSTKLVVYDEQYIPPNWRTMTQHALMNGARKLQLWHGIPMKRIGMETLTARQLADPMMVELLHSMGPYDALVATSAASEESWRRQLMFTQFAPIGYPRDDVLLRDCTERDWLNVDQDVLALLRDKKGKPAICYAPTFRDNNQGAWLEQINLDKIAAACAARDWHFIVNLHPYEHQHIPRLRQQYPAVHFVESGCDVFPILKFCDVLVTGYSSIAFDYLLLDRPIVFYRPNHVEYVNESRTLVDGHERYLCGPVADTHDALIQQLERAIQVDHNPEKDTYRSHRHALAHDLYDVRDGKAGDRVCQLILQQLRK
ncbi:MAG: CDP-glycerol glycerophosphotransferase family protein [Alphaproteobacteria bacterium]|nr:CDP-glycerol glycerophosphotransferase family protein [Alphaproteobacteria bacterium]MBV8548775.1 CDP-glycerol glycerophosphotransferase family protein [Alphaproteobacteria bacterium]